MGDTAEKTKKVGFFSKVSAEFKKIIWPDKASVTKKTIAVVILTVILGAIIAVIDTVFTYGINFLIGL